MAVPNLLECAATNAAKVKCRRLGRTGFEVSEIGFGAWGIGRTAWIGANDETSIQALKAAREAGINFFDTALAYGEGHSEQLLARVFGKSHGVLIGTKVPPKDRVWPAYRGAPLRQVFPKRYVLECLDVSLRNLGRERIDLYQFHVWSDHWAKDPEWQSTVEAMRTSGKVTAVGISVNDHQPENVIQALETGLVDSVQLIYNIFDQSPEDKLFPYCQKKNIGVIARVPFDEGSLAGAIRPDTTFPSGDFRNSYFGQNRKREVWARVERLVSDVGITLDDLPRLALRFCTSHPAVSTVIPGMRTPAHVYRNASTSMEEPLSDEILNKLKNHRWARNFYTQQQTFAGRVKAKLSRLLR